MILTLKTVHNSGQWTSLASAWTSCKGNCCGWKYLLTLSWKQWGASWTITLAERKWSSSVLKQKLTRWRKHGQGCCVIPQGDLLAERWERVPREQLHSAWNMNCSMLMSHISSFPGVDARAGAVVAWNLFIKTVYLRESLCLSFVPK